MALLWIGAGFLSGSLLFSYWLGLLVGKDVRTVGDGNPGAANAIKAAGLTIGLVGGILDMLKGALPLALATWPLNYFPWMLWLVPIAVAPVLGHVFSPWLGGKRGKGIAATFGIWAGLTAWQVPCVLGGACAFCQVRAPRAQCLDRSPWYGGSHLVRGHQVPPPSSCWGGSAQ